MTVDHDDDKRTARAIGTSVDNDGRDYSDDAAEREVDVWAESEDMPPDYYDQPDAAEAKQPRASGADHVVADRVTAEQGAGKPDILIEPGRREYVVNAAIGVLAARPNVYQRASQLVRSVPLVRAPDAAVTLQDSGRLEPWSFAALDLELESSVRFSRISDKEIVDADSPQWLSRIIIASKVWPSVRPLTAVVSAPIIVATGEVINVPGYHAPSGVLFEPLPGTRPVAVPSHPTLDDVARARARLEEIVRDFPFVLDAHRAGWLAYAATLASRFAFTGPTPLFWFDAPTPGTGKGLLEWAGSYIALGHEAHKGAWSLHDESEQRKLITSIAIAGTRAVLFDNVKRGSTLGGPVLCQILTQSTWSDRILGGNEMFHGGWHAVLACTGNNVELDEDMHRRVVHIRLEPKSERPEERDPTSFRWPNLEHHVREHHSELLGALLTILRGYVVHGRPRVKLVTWHSYAEWSQAVRAPLVWAGLDDPALALAPMRESGVTPDHMHARFVARLADIARELDWKEFRACDLHQKLYERGVGGGYFQRSDAFAELRLAIAEVRDVATHGELSVKSLGKLLASVRGRVYAVDDAAYAVDKTTYRLKSRMLRGVLWWSVPREGL